MLATLEASVGGLHAQIAGNHGVEARMAAQIRRW